MFLNKKLTKVNYFLNHQLTLIHTRLLNNDKYDFENDETFKCGELVLANIITKPQKSKRYAYLQSKMFVLKETSILRTRYFDVMHKHIIGRKSADCLFKIMDDDGILIQMKRPTLYEFVQNTPQAGTPSQYSIITLVPFLIEIENNTKILESGTGSGCMTLFLSKHLTNDGCIHTYDIQSGDTPKNNFDLWKNSYNLRNTSNKWTDNVVFYKGVDILKHEFDKKFEEYYDVVFLDLLNVSMAMMKVYKLLKSGGILVVNTMQLLEIVKLRNLIEQQNLNLKCEIVIEPSNRIWEINRPVSIAKSIENGEATIDQFKYGYVCRVEDSQESKRSRGGLYSNLWPGFLAKFRKT